MKKEIKPLIEIFFETLKKHELTGVIEYEFYSMYEHLFKILSKETLEGMIDRAYRDRKTDYWFHDFHKSIRQCDIYDNCYILNPNPTIDKKEQQELNKLNKELELVYKKLDKFEKEQKGTIPATTDPTYVQKQAEFDVKYRSMHDQLWPKEKRLRRRTLNDLLREEAKKSINGHLDVILHTTIGIDNKGILSNTLERTFNEFEFLKKQNRKKLVTND